MKTLSVRELRTALPKIEQMLARSGSIAVTRRGREILRIVPAAEPARTRPRFPSNAALRAKGPFLEIPSEVLLREDRER